MFEYALEPQDLRAKKLSAYKYDPKCVMMVEKRKKDGSWPRKRWVIVCLCCSGEPESERRCADRWESECASPMPIDGSGMF